MRDRYMEEFGYEGDHGKVVSIEVTLEQYICPVCQEENTKVIVGGRIIFGTSCYSSIGETCSRCGDLTKEEAAHRVETGRFKDAMWRTKEELEGHTIIVDRGEMFWGQVEHFENCFFDNCDEETITDWCAENGWSLNIVRGIIEPPKN